MAPKTDENYVITPCNAVCGAIKVSGFITLLCSSVFGQNPAKFLILNDVSGQLQGVVSGFVTNPLNL